MSSHEINKLKMLKTLFKKFPACYAVNEMSTTLDCLNAIVDSGHLNFSLTTSPPLPHTHVLLTANVCY